MYISYILTPQFRSTPIAFRTWGVLLNVHQMSQYSSRTAEEIKIESEGKTFDKSSDYICIKERVGLLFCLWLYSY